MTFMGYILVHGFLGARCRGVSLAFLSRPSEVGEGEERRGDWFVTALTRPD